MSTLKELLKQQLLKEVALLIVFIGLISMAGKKAKKGDAERQLSKMKGYGKVTLLSGVAIVVLAVSVFK